MANLPDRLDEFKKTFESVAPPIMRRTRQSTEVLSDGKSLNHMEGTFSIVGGRGKMKGIKGKGTYTCKGVPGGTSACQVEGEHTLPQ